MTGGEQLTRLRPWNVLAVALLVLYLAGIVLFCYAAVTSTPAPTAYAITRPPFDAYGDPRAWWPVALQLALGAAAFGAYYLPRRHETRSFSLLVTGVLGISTIVLGVLGAWNCLDTESPFFAPLAIALALLLGNPPSFTGVCEDLPLPLAVQAARLFGPLLLVITALGIAATLFRAQLDRLVVRFFSRSLVVVVGLSEEALPLVRRLATDLPKRTVLTVLVAGESPLVRLTRQLGARVVVCDVDDPRALRVLVLRQRRFKVQALYLVSADVSANLRWARRFRDLADTSRPLSTEPPPRITARIDDPWQAEYWRRTNAYRTPSGKRAQSVRWVSDALSVPEVTAALLVGHVQSRPHDRLAVVGRSSLALAICAELAQRQREGSVLTTQAHPSFAELVLVGPGAADLRAQHEIRQERFGNPAEAAAITVEPIEPTEDGLAALLAGNATPAVIFTDESGSHRNGLSPTLLAARHPTWTIYVFDGATEGLVRRPIMEQLYPFGLTIEPPEGAAVDSWERAARVVHQTYLNSLGDQRDPTKPAQRPWIELAPFYRASNVRLVTATLAGAESVGRTWGPIPEERADTATTGVPPHQLREMARLEHESWHRFYAEQGWRYGPHRDDARRVHNAMLPWDRLSPDYQDRTVGNVRDALSTLHALGYRSWTAGADRCWLPVSRRGEVRATVLDRDWRWQTRSGEWLQARVGDYQVRNGTGEMWSVDREIFTRSYEHVAGDRWRRTGEVFAQPAVPGELVISLEGPDTAGDGDWVIKGAAGEQWLTSAEHFATNYERVGA